MTRQFRSKPFYYRVFGDYALFTSPETRGGGEKMTYQVPTYSALKGITEAIYWKPSLHIIIDEVIVIHPIETETMGVRTLVHRKKGGNGLSYYTYLRNVEYYVKFHFEWNLNRLDLKHDHNEIKHEQIMLRSMKRGGRRDIFLGTRECVGYIEPLSADEYQGANSPYQDERLNLGIMFHSFTYPDEAYSPETEDKLTSNYTELKMINGKISFPRPEECSFKHPIRDYDFKHFGKNSYTSVDDEVIVYDEMEGEVE